MSADGSTKLEHVERVLAWCEHMLDDHPVLVYFSLVYVFLSTAAIVGLATR